MAVCSEVGDGSSTLFWSDKWLHDKSITELAPRLMPAVVKLSVNRRTVKEALTNRQWLADIKGALSVADLREFFSLWDTLNKVYNRKLKIFTFGSCLLPANSQQSRFMMLYSKEQLNLAWLIVFGTGGLLGNVSSFCG